MFGANYGAKQPDTTAYIKSFFAGSQLSLWQIVTMKINNLYINAITTATKNYTNLFIPGDIYVQGNIINNPLQQNIDDIYERLTNLENEITQLKI
jgi:hypothetical protein